MHPCRVISCHESWHMLRRYIHMFSYEFIWMYPCRVMSCHHRLRIRKWLAPNGASYMYLHDMNTHAHIDICITQHKSCIWNGTSINEQRPTVRRICVYIYDHTRTHWHMYNTTWLMYMKWHIYKWAVPNGVSYMYLHDMNTHVQTNVCITRQDSLIWYHMCVYMM